MGLVRVEGQIRAKGTASADKVIPALRNAFEDTRVEKVVIVVDSPGGSPVEAERIGTEIDVLRKQYKKPVYVAIGNLGASAGYLVAMHADRIYAAKYSLVGSIGAVLSSWNAQKAINRLDIYQNVYASGELKGMLNPFSEPSERAGQKAQELVDLAGGQFLADLQARRAGKLKADVDYGTGEVWNGVKAQQLGLVDELGTLETIAAAEKVEFVDFGPGRKNSSLPVIGTALQEFTTKVLSGAIQDAVETAGDLQLR
jgi:protease-4